MTASVIRVDLADRGYDIVLCRGSLLRLGELVVARRSATHAVLVTDRNVQAHAERAADSLAAQAIGVDVIMLDPGEATKSPDKLFQLWEGLLELRADRRTLVAAVGGGVIGDLAGMAAATYARGLDFVQVPTTLLAQVDSSVGGKVGVNLPRSKNQVGAFWQPRLVVVDVETLHTLPDREYRSGLAEVVKYGAALDAEFFGFLESNVSGLNARTAEVLEPTIARCCRLKADAVERDERDESGLRAVLNYGHTFAHALESVTGYGHYLHGEAVAIGLHCAARLAERMGRIDAVFVARQRQLLESLQLPCDVPLDISRKELLDAMRHDKKAADGQLRFLLPTRLGQVELVGNIPERDVAAVLDAEKRHENP